MDQMSLRLAPLLLAVVLTGACINPNSVVCSDGRTCPSDTRCDVQRRLCVSDAQVLACVDHDEGTACTIEMAPGLCHDGLCERLFCGDGRRVGSESCDGADLNGKTCADLGFYRETTGLKCNPTECTFDTSGCADACGDKVLNGDTELCDGDDLGGADCRTAGFYEGPGLRCSPYCTLDVSQCKGSCGDKTINGPEQCDGAPPAGKTCVEYGFDRGTLGCSSLCGPQLEGCAQIGWRSVLSNDFPVIAVWGAGPDDVFAVGWGGTIVRGSGTSWTKMKSNTTTNLWGVWGSSPDNVFAVGGEGTGGVVLHWDGVAWKSMDVPPSGLYSSVWGSGPNDVFVMDRYAHLVRRWDGKIWTTLPELPETQGYTEVLWGSGPNDLYAIGDGIVRWDGTKWSQAWDPFDFVSLQAIWGSGPKDIFAVASGFIVHWDGTQWSRTNVDSTLWLGGVWGTSPRDVLVVAFGDERTALLHWNGTNWSDVGSLEGVRKVRMTAGIWGSSPSDIYIAGVGGLRHSNGDNWSATSVKGAINSLWAAGPDDLFALGNDLFTPSTGCPPKCMESSFSISRFYGLGSSTTNVPSPPSSLGILGDQGRLWGTSSTDLFAAMPLQIQHWNGKDWSPSYVPGPPDAGTISPSDLWGSGPNNVYAIGATGDHLEAGTCTGIARWDGSQWTVMPFSLAKNCLSAVWVSSQGEVFAVGVGGEIVHSDGKTWSTMRSGSTENLWSVWGSGPRDVYAVGEAGTILHFDGTAWSPMPTGTTASLFLVRGSGPADVFVIGDDALLHLRGGAWESIVLPSQFKPTSMAVTPQKVYLAGGKDPNGTGQLRYHLYRNGVTCSGPETNCGDGWDNDCDGLADGADPDCKGKALEQCANGIDDDLNGKVDCADVAGCATFPSCRHK